MDEDNPNNYWQVIQNEGKTYIYNIGARKYLCSSAIAAAAPMRSIVSASASVQTDWQLSATPQSLTVTDGSHGISIGNSGDWLFVLNDYLAVNENVSGIESVVCDETSTSPYINLQGQKVAVPQRGKIIVRKGKKTLVK